MVRAECRLGSAGRCRGGDRSVTKPHTTDPLRPADAWPQAAAGSGAGRPPPRNEPRLLPSPCRRRDRRPGIRERRAAPRRGQPFPARRGLLDRGGAPSGGRHRLSGRSPHCTSPFGWVKSTFTALLEPVPIRPRPPRGPPWFGPPVTARHGVSALPCRKGTPTPLGWPTLPTDPLAPPRTAGPFPRPCPPLARPSTPAAAAWPRRTAPAPLGRRLAPTPPPPVRPTSSRTLGPSHRS